MMAERRMFAKTIIDSDAFLDMPTSSQTLYFHLAMRADDEGFINNPKKIQRMVGCSDDDLKLLIAKNFIIPFESGVVVIKHWKIHNYIRKDRIQNTVYQDEKSMLEEKENGSYKLSQSDVSQLPAECQHRLGKDSIGKVRIVEDSVEADKPPTKRFTIPTLEEVEEYCLERNKGVNPNKWYNHYTSNGWMVGKVKMKDWKAAVRKWEQDKPSQKGKDWLDIEF